MGNSGSRWLRWEPHIHAPGAVLNDQFKGTDTRAEYLARIEAATPQFRALGVTATICSTPVRRSARLNIATIVCLVSLGS